MFNLRQIAVEYRRLKIRLKLRLLRSRGLKYGKDFRCMGGVQFGSEPYLIKIGDHVTISFEVVFVTHDGGTWVYRETENKKYTKYAPIVVGNNCFIGCRSLMLPGAQLGNNCVVAAGAVVTKAFPDNVVVGGVPAKILGSTQDYIDKAVELDQQLWFSANRKKELLEIFSDKLS